MLPKYIHNESYEYISSLGGYRSIQILGKYHISNYLCLTQTGQGIEATFRIMMAYLRETVKGLCIGDNYSGLGNSLAWLS